MRKLRIFLGLVGRRDFASGDRIDVKFAWRLACVLACLVLLLVAAAPMPQAVVKTGSITRQFYSSGESVSWTRLRMSATWTTKEDGTPCVKVTYVGVSHWTKDGWGKWQRLATNVTPSGCQQNVTRYTTDKWLSPPGIPDYRVYLEGAVNSANPGKFYWENVVTQ